jgi:UDP-N-acetylglucosamine 4,6-dehydratase
MSDMGSESWVVAITGGTGSFGSTMTKALLARGVDRVHIFSRDEAKQDQMRREIGDDRCRFFLGDVREIESIRPALVGATHVFHAAALKQVPSGEFFPQQVVATNVLGSDNVVRAAARSGVQSLVCLSTDKAVYPVNAMGMTKALMEKTAQAYARNNPDSDMVVSVTRYGNVMCSRGSVIPLFVKQIRDGGPVTITDGDMTRFLMSLGDSVTLVEHAFKHAVGGDLFVRKAPACTVEVLAKAVAMALDVPEPQMRVIGSRHGEKKHETLLSREEMLKAEDQGDYYRVPLDARSLQYELFFDQGERELSALDDYTSENTEQMTVEEAAALLADLPEFGGIVQ